MLMAAIVMPPPLAATRDDWLRLLRGLRAAGTSDGQALALVGACSFALREVIDRMR
jgi:hypothetical protein